MKLTKLIFMGLLIISTIAFVISISIITFGEYTVDLHSISLYSLVGIVTSCMAGTCFD